MHGQVSCYPPIKSRVDELAINKFVWKKLNPISIKVIGYNTMETNIQKI